MIALAILEFGVSTALFCIVISDDRGEDSNILNPSLISFYLLTRFFKIAQYSPPPSAPAINQDVSEILLAEAKTSIEMMKEFAYVLYEKQREASNQIFDYFTT